MGEIIERLRNQLNDFWQGLDKKKKIKLGIALLAVILIAVAIFLMTRTKYESIFSNLSPKEAGEITATLDEKGIPWKIGETDGTIMVPKEMSAKAKMELAMVGMPKEGYTFTDAFADIDWTTTEYDKSQKMKLALEETLSADLTQIEGVDSAKVYLNIPENTGYVLQDDKYPTASVLLTLRKGSIRKGTVDGIQHLVSHAVGGDMKPAHVSVVDGDGKLLTTDSSNELADANDQLGMQKVKEDALNKSIKDFLERPLGQGNVDVRTSIKLNFNSEVINTKEYTPPIEGSEDGIIRSLEENTEKSTNSATGRAPGVDANTQEETVDYAQGDQANDSKQEKNQRIVNYEMNEKVQQTQSALGRTEAITVAVIINEEAIGGSLTDDRRKEITNLISSAAGTETIKVEISTMAFNKTDVAEEETDDGETPLWVKALIGTLLAAALIGGYIFYKRYKDKKAIDEEMDSLSQINELIEDAASDLDELSFDQEKSEMKEQISKFVDKNPDLVVQLLRTWMNEE